MTSINKLKSGAKISGLAGALLILFGLILPWLSFDYYDLSGALVDSFSNSGLEIISGQAQRFLMNPRIYLDSSYIFPYGLKQTVYIVLVGGILALSGAVALLADVFKKVAPYLLSFGGVLALVGVFLSLRVEIPSLIDYAKVLAGYLRPPQTINAIIGPGTSVSMIGSVLAIISIFGTKTGN